MKSTLRLFALPFVIAFVLLTGAGPASARVARFPRHHPLPKPVYTAISSVDRSAMTITTAPKNSTGTTPKTYRFTSQSKITVNGQPGTLADLKPGQRIRVGLGADDNFAEELAVTSPPPGAGGHKKRPHPSN